MRKEQSKELLQIKEEAMRKIEECDNLKLLNELRVHYLGKKGPIQEAMKQMKTLAPEERSAFGQISNEVKQAITNANRCKKSEIR